MDGYAELRAFRATHPYQSLTVGGVEWKYISGPAATEAAGAAEAAAVAQGARPALLVLGGGFSFGDSAFRTIAAFEPRFRVISPSYPPVRTMAELLAGVAAILDAEGIQSASVFGHSLGAGVAHAFSRRYPLRVDKLILSGFGLYTQGHTRLVRAFVRLFAMLPKAALAAFYRPRIARLLEGAEDDERAFLSAYTEDLFAAHTRESALARLAVLLDLAANPDRYAATSPFERPEDVLLIAASDDRGFTPREREALLAAYPGARTYVFGTGGHWAAVTHPAEYAGVVGRFLDGRPLSVGRDENPAAPPGHAVSEYNRDDRETGPSATLDARLEAFRASHPYGTLDVDGVRWRYLAGGSGEQTVLLPSGGTRMPDMYLLLIEALERDFRVLAPAYPAGAGIAGLADGLAAILDAEGVEQADVLGSSFGGFVAQMFTRRHPQRVRRLVLANTGGPAAAPLPVLRLLIRFLAVLPENAVRSLTGWTWRRWFVPDSHDDAVFWNMLLSDILSQLGKEDLLSALREMYEFAHLPALAGAGASTTPPTPVLLIESERDEVFPPQARAALRGLYPAAEVRLFAGAGHGVMATRSAEYIDAVREFLRRP